MGKGEAGDIFLKKNPNTVTFCLFICPASAKCNNQDQEVFPSEFSAFCGHPPPLPIASVYGVLTG